MSGDRVIAIDGPGGAGKTTVSKAVADRLGLNHLDTGAYYRAATLVALQAGIDIAGGSEAPAEIIGAVDSARFEYRSGSMMVDGEDVSGAIRSEVVTASVSAVSAIPELRRRMVDHQRDWVAGRSGVVVEGRDIGTVVFPYAAVKIFLTARADVRAWRRAGDQPTASSVEAVSADLARRDRLDSTRDLSPLMQAKDATVLDTSEMPFERVVGAIMELASEAGFGQAH